MSRTKIQLIIIAFVACVLAVSFVIFARVSLKPEALKAKLIPRLSEVTRGDIDVQEASFHYFPSLAISMNDIEYQSREFAQTSLKANHAKVYLKILPALFGKARIAKIEVEEAETTLRLPDTAFLDRVEMTHMSLKVSSIRARAPIRFEVKGNLEGVPDSLHAKGFWTVQSLEKWDWQATHFSSKVRAHNFPVRILQQRLRASTPMRLKDGVFETEFEIQKEKGDTWIEIAGDTALRQFIYEIQNEAKRTASPVMDLDLNFKTKWNPRGEELQIQRFFLKSPAGMMELSGGLLLGTREVQNMRVTAYDISMESLPHYFIPLNEAIPFNIGFSGMSDLEMSIEGTLDHLSIHANWDLTPALLTYARYFDKPKDLPLNVVFDYMLVDSHMLSGDFSIRIKNATIKGTFKELDLRTADGQLNIITNKFDLEEWQALILPLEGYDVDGDMKLLLNLKGDLDDPKNLERLINVTISRGRVSYAGGEPLEDVSVLLDYSPLLLDIRKIGFSVDGDPVEANLKVYNLFQNPAVQAEIKSEKFKLTPFLRILSQLSARWLPERESERLRLIQRHVTNVLPEGEALEDFGLKIRSEKGEWDISDVSFRAYEGKIGLKATVDNSTALPTYWTDVSIDRMSLAKYTGRGSENEPWMGGSLFLEGQFVGVGFEAGDWQDHIQGEGNMMVTNGEFRSFNILETLGSVQEFENLNFYASDTTRFNDLHANFRLRDGKIVAEDMSLLSSDLFVEAQGDYSINGFLNYKLDVYLSPGRTDDILAPLLKVPEIAGDQQFGPIPLLLSGKLEKAVLQTDDSALALLLDEVTNQKTHKILRNFLPEESFFGRLDAGRR